MRKNIDITEAAVQSINAMALNEDRSVKNLIERNLEAMGKHGITYIDLWHQCERMTARLKDLSINH